MGFRVPLAQVYQGLAEIQPPEGMQWLARVMVCWVVAEGALIPVELQAPGVMAGNRAELRVTEGPRESARRQGPVDRHQCGWFPPQMV